MELKSKIDSELLPFVNKPARYLGNEYNTVLKPLHSIELRAALCFPDLYDSGIQNISFELMYHLLNAQPFTWAERFYTPGADTEQVMLNADIPLFSLESKTALFDFDVAVFFVQDRFTFTNVLNMLHLGRTLLKSRERQADWPFVMGCGPAFNNPEPMADFFDMVMIGEWESVFFKAVDLLRHAKKEQRTKHQTLQRLSQLPGVYIPSFYQPVYNNFREFQGIEKTEASAPDRITPSTGGNTLEKQSMIKPLVPLFEHSPARSIVEESGGTPSHNGGSADFQATANRLAEPASLKGADHLFRELQKLLRRSIGNNVDLLLANDANANEMFWMLIKEKASLGSTGIYVSFPSFQLGIQHALSPGVTDTLTEYGFLLSPLAGSQRLRNVLNINVREQELLQALKIVLESGWKTIRLAFAVGLPGEKDEDIVAIAELVKKCLQTAESRPGIQFFISVHLFSPAVHTPLQWEKQESPAVLEKKLSFLQEQLAALPVKVHFQEPFSASLKTALTRGDRRLGEVIENAWKLGVRFERSKENLPVNRWQQAFENAGITLEDYLSPISITVPLPWDHIDVGVSKAFLKEEKLRAGQGQLHPQNKDIVSIGYGGMPRNDFEKWAKSAGRDKLHSANTAAGVLGRQPAADTGAETMRFGRRSRKRETPVAVIKRKIRIRYSKTGLMRFLTHSDIVRVFDRSAQLAKIPLVYSQGLRRNPKIAYGPPLPVNISSIAEYLDMEVEIGREVDLQSRFNQFLPEGLKILQFQEIYAKSPALAAIINRAMYEAYMPDGVISQEWINQWLAQPQAPAKRVSKEGTREVDIRPFLRGLEWADNRLLITIDSIEGKTAKVVEILESLLLPQGMDYRYFPVQRTGQFIVRDNEILTPFEVL